MRYLKLKAEPFPLAVIKGVPAGYQIVTAINAAGQRETVTAINSQGRRVAVWARKV